MVKYFTVEELENAVDMKKLIYEMKNALVDLNNKDVIVPDRYQISSSLHESTYLFMPAYSEKIDKVSLKYVAVCNENPKMSLPLVNGIVILADGKTGIVDAMFDGSKLTALRTGAVGGAAVDELSIKEAKVLSIFGTGNQAETQVRAAISVRNIETIYIFYRHRDEAKQFLKKMKQYFNGEIVLSEDFKYLEESDIIITATTSTTPVFDSVSVKLKDHVHITAIGSFTPKMQELDSDLYANCIVFTDNKEDCLRESGDLIIPIKEGKLNKRDLINLGEIINSDSDKIKNKKTLFKSVGNACFDLYAANFFFLGSLHNSVSP